MKKELSNKTKKKIIELINIKETYFINNDFLIKKNIIHLINYCFYSDEDYRLIINYYFKILYKNAMRYSYYYDDLTKWNMKVDVVYYCNMNCYTRIIEILNNIDIYIVKNKLTKQIEEYIKLKTEIMHNKFYFKDDMSKLSSNEKIRFWKINNQLNEEHTILKTIKNIITYY